MGLEEMPFVLVAEEGSETYQLAVDTFKESGIENPVHWVKDGEELMAFLHQRNSSTTLVHSGIILLDLNLPKRDGRQALSEIKSHPHFRKIPVIILSKPQEKQDIINFYDLGVNSFIEKPMQAEELVKMIQTISRFWFEIAKLPA